MNCSHNKGVLDFLNEVEIPEVEIPDIEIPEPLPPPDTTDTLELEDLSNPFKYLEDIAGENWKLIDIELNGLLFIIIYDGQKQSTFNGFCLLKNTVLEEYLIMSEDGFVFIKSSKIVWIAWKHHNKENKNEDFKYHKINL